MKTCFWQSIQDEGRQGEPRANQLYRDLRPQLQDHWCRPSQSLQQVRQDWEGVSSFAKHFISETKTTETLRALTLSKGLHFSCELVENIFNPKIVILKVNVVVDGPSRRSRGFAFLYFETVATAKEAKEVLPNKSLNLLSCQEHTQELHYHM